MAFNRADLTPLSASDLPGCFSMKQTLSGVQRFSKMLDGKYILILNQLVQPLGSTNWFNQVDKPLAQIYNSNKNFCNEEQLAMTVELTIINAAIECIEKYGIQGTTNRRIAEIAGISNAAINYYFRTKDILIAQTLALTLENAFDFANFEDPPDASPKQRCMTIFNDLIVGSLNYPGITRAHIYPLLVEGKYTPEVVARLNQFTTQLAADLHTRGCLLPEEELHLAIAQATMAVLMAVLSPALFADGLHTDLRLPQDRQRFVTRLVNRLFSEVANG